MKHKPFRTKQPPTPKQHNLDDKLKQLQDTLLHEQQQMRQSNSSRWTLNDTKNNTGRSFHQIIQQQKQQQQKQQQKEQKEQKEQQKEQQKQPNKYQLHQQQQLLKQQEQIKSITKQADPQTYTKIESLGQVLKLGKQQQSCQDGDPIYQFLYQINCCQYYQVFVENGFDELDTVLELTSQHMTDMRVLPGHQIKIQKLIYQIRNKAKGRHAEENKGKQVEEIKGRHAEEIKGKQAEENKGRQAGMMKINYNSAQQIRHTMQQNYILNKEGTEHMDVQVQSNHPMQISSRSSCYHCYRLYEHQQDGTSLGPKQFCSGVCLLKYQQQNMVEC